MKFRVWPNLRKKKMFDRQAEAFEFPLSNLICWGRLYLSQYCCFQRQCLMRRSNRNFNIPPPPPGQTPGIWLFSVPGEWGIWRIRPSRGWGIWPCLGGVEKIEPEVSGFNFFFFPGAEVANSYKHVFGRDGRVWRKRYSICERLTYKKRSSKVRVLNY